MKKLLSFLLVLLLIASLSGTCLAESHAPLTPRAESAQIAAEAHAPERAGLSRHASYPSYSRRSDDGGIISKAIAAMVLCGISALIKPLFGKSGKKDQGQEGQEPQEPQDNLILPTEKFICKSCRKGSSGWYQVCPNCGASGQMEQNKAYRP